MSAWRWGGALAIVMACTSEVGRSAGTPLEHGRTYTAWLYERQYEKLWERFSPEMRQAFGSVTDLASFAGRAIQRLGAERETVDEVVAKEAPFNVYTRTASFDRAKDPVLIQWSLTDSGMVTGLVVRPVPRRVAVHTQ